MELKFRQIKNMEILHLTIDKKEEEAKEEEKKKIKRKREWK